MMADPIRQPCYKAIQQCMDRITQIVIYDEVKDMAFAKELISLDEYDRLSNIEAVQRMTRKAMCSIAGCEKFLKILQEIPGDQYGELAKLITDKLNTIKLQLKVPMQPNVLHVQHHSSYKNDYVWLVMKNKLMLL